MTVVRRHAACSSASRMGTTRAASVVRHPLWTAGTIVARAGRPARAGNRAAGGRSPRAARVSAAPVGTNATVVRRARRVGCDSLDRSGEPAPSGRSRRCSVTRRPAWSTSVKVPAGASFVCGCALSPQVWQERPPRSRSRSRCASPRRTAARPGATKSPSRSIRARSGPIGAGIRSRSRSPRRLSPRSTSTSRCRLASRAAVGRQRLGPFRRAALRVAPPRHRESAARSTPSRAACAPTACATRSSSCARSGIAGHDAEAYARWVARHTRDEAGARAA